MISLAEELLNTPEKEPNSAIFFKFKPGEAKPVLIERLGEIKSLGIKSVIAGCESEGMKEYRFEEAYYQTLQELAAACAELQMSFWLEDYSPFPTGSANGAYHEQQYVQLNKLFIDERHMDIRGPIKSAVIRIDALQSVVYGKTMHRFAKVDPTGRKRLAVVAYRMQENIDGIFSPVLDDKTSIRLDSFIEGSYLSWDIPDGYWRIFVLFTTRESAGRPYFMNLLSKDSVALEIEMVHKPIYECLERQLGKVWNGFFYDEPEIGNAGGDGVFDFFMLPGRRTKEETDCNVYPWSAELLVELEKRAKDWLEKLPLLWYDATAEHVRFRYTYMDIVTSLVRDNYNGQVYSFCRERGIHYMGHVLEDEGSHSRLGCGPGHYFRQQYYQDEAGIDVIAGQILPGRDNAASWYGVVNADGEFYHYGLAKLASSEAHINPLKKNRSMCETFAMYGQQGFAEKKFLIDHLMINGVNRILYGDLSINKTPDAYAKVLVEYTDRICNLLKSTTPVIRTAILYHAEAEWMEGEQAQRFQIPARELARNQISYDVIPADVFAFPERYEAILENELNVNGNVYEALIIPACSRLPEVMEKFVKQCKENGFPVFFVDRMPKMFEEENAQKSNIRLVTTKELALAVQKTISMDIHVEASDKKWIRSMYVRKEQEELYLIHNEAPKGGIECNILIKAENEVLEIDPVSGMVWVPAQERQTDGTIRVSLKLEQYEMSILYTGCKSISNVIHIGRERRHEAAWELELSDGQWVTGVANELPKPEQFLETEFYGRLIYRTQWIQGEDLPAILNLGKVSDCCEVTLNGKKLGKRIAAPYIFDVQTAIRSGMNELIVEVYTSAANGKNDQTVFGIPLNNLTALPYTLVEDMGMRGTVKWF